MSNLDIVTDYLDNFSEDDARELAEIKLIALMCFDNNLEPSRIPNLIDRIALFNNIKKLPVKRIEV